VIKISQLYLRYGAMNCGKSAHLLMVAHNYEEQEKRVLLFKPFSDTRSAKGFIESRTGMKHECIDIDEHFNFSTYINTLVSHHKQIDCILIDEGHWLTKEQVKQLCNTVDYVNIPIIIYCLKNSYVDGELLEGVKYLLYYADKIEELKTVCVWCDKKSIMNLRILNGKPIYDGNTTHVGDVEVGEDFYLPTCRKHYFNPVLK
jgi:thymidine kinase